MPATVMSVIVRRTEQGETMSNNIEVGSTFMMMNKFQYHLTDYNPSVAEHGHKNEEGKNTETGNNNSGEEETNGDSDQGSITEVEETTSRNSFEVESECGDTDQGPSAPFDWQDHGRDESIEI